MKWSRVCTLKIIIRYNRDGYNLHVMRQSVCPVFNPVTVNNYASFFNCTPMDRASDSMMVLFILVGRGRVTGDSLLHQIFSGVV